MIPKTIHYCWFGHGEMPQLAKDCIDSWHRYMPDWEFKLWNEDNFNVNQIPYTKEAYEARKYAFVSDFVRLWALKQEGGVYLDIDVEVFKSFDDLLQYKAFAGFEGSKRLPLGTSVMASEANGRWVSDMLEGYRLRHFIVDNHYDLTTNVQFISAKMSEKGFAQNGNEQDYMGLHVFPVDYFCPRQTSGEFLLTENTYCDHHGLGTWEENVKGWKSVLCHMVGQKRMTSLIKLKRKFFG